MITCCGNSHLVVIVVQDEANDSAIVATSKQLAGLLRESLVKSKDVFFCLPTCSEKSPCYCLLPYSHLTRRAQEYGASTLISLNIRGEL